MWRNPKPTPCAGVPTQKVVARPHYMFDARQDLPMITVHEHTGDTAQKILIQYFSLVILLNNLEKDM